MVSNYVGWCRILHDGAKLQDSAERSCVMQNRVRWCKYTAIWYRIVRVDVEWYGMVQHDAEVYKIVLFVCHESRMAHNGV